MKRKVLVTLLALLFVNLTFASPVDIETAKSIGERFVRNNMQSLRGFQNSKHVLTSIVPSSEYAKTGFALSSAETI